MKEENEKQVEIVQPIAFNFKKKIKEKPKTDRSHNITYDSAKSGTKNEHSQFNSPKVSLIEKKKQYSMAIREKNLNTLNVKKTKNQYYQTNQLIKLNSTEISRSNSLMANGSELFSNKLTSKLKSINNKENDLTKKPKDNNRSKTRVKKLSAAIENLKDCDISGNLFSPNTNDNTLFTRLSEIQNFQEISVINEFPVMQKIFSISSQFNQSYGPYESGQSKEIELIKRQNTTFKRELAAFRKQNGTLKRQLEDCKKKMLQFKEKNDYLTTQSEDQIKLLEAFQSKIAESLELNCSFKSETQCLQEDKLDQNDKRMQEILQSYENQLFQANSLNKKLEFRNYMLQKRLLDESESHRKILAREISTWKERYIKARNQNIRMKDSRNSTLFDMSISEEM